MRAEIDQFYLSKPEPLQGCLLALRDIVLARIPELQEAWKYRMPCFTYQGRHFCYVWVEKNSGRPYLSMVDGRRIDHPGLVHKDKTKRMKVLFIAPEADLPIDSIHEILDMGLAIRQEK